MQFDWKSYFIFTAKEQKGIIVLGCILFLSLLLHYLLPADQIDQANSKTSNEKPKKLFYFDPNELDSLTGYQLGLTRKQMTTLYHYREKGGRFYKKEDLFKLYGLSKTQAVQLMPWVKIKDSIKRNWAFKKQNQERIDINDSSAADWIRITGLPAYKVKRILMYQKWSGGFQSLNGLKRVHGITAFDFEMIRPFIQYQSKLVQKMSYQTMRFEDWMSLGIFDEKTVWEILRQKKKQQGRLNWSEMVIQFDLTEDEANTLKKRTNLSN